MKGKELGYILDRLTGARKPGIIFVHIPKTGGSSISAALRKHYRLSKFNIKSEVTSLAAQKRFDMDKSLPGYDEALQELRLALIFHEGQKNTRYITGHFWANGNLSSLKPLGYSIITCLRDPVDRWFSQYLYGRYKEGSHGKIDQDIEEYIQGPDAAALATTYVRYLGGIREDREYSSADAVQAAIDNLDLFDLVGFLHNMKEFRVQITRMTGFKLHAAHRRKSPAAPDQRDRIKGSREIRNAVEKLCGPDLEVYEKALLKFPVQP